MQLFTGSFKVVLVNEAKAGETRERERDCDCVCGGACLALENSEHVWATWQDPATETKQLTRIISCLEMGFKFVSSI